MSKLSLACWNIIGKMRVLRKYSCSTSSKSGNRRRTEEARALMGEDYWPYGFARNRGALATFLRYHHEQGLSRRLLQPEELFAPETMESFKI